MASEIRGSDNFDSSEAGKVLQVVQASNFTQQDIASTAWVDTALTVTITPTATTSRVRIDYNFQEVNVGSPTASGISLRILRDSTSLFTATSGFAVYANANAHATVHGVDIDSPSTTSPIIYKIQVRGYNTNVVRINQDSSYKSTIIATEIGA